MKLIFTTILLACICSAAQATIIDYSESLSGDLKDTGDAFNRFTLDQAGEHMWSGSSSLTDGGTFFTSDDDAFFIKLLGGVQIDNVSVEYSATSIPRSVIIDAVTSLSSANPNLWRYAGSIHTGSDTFDFAPPIGDSAVDYKVYNSWFSIQAPRRAATYEWDWKVIVTTREAVSVPEPTASVLMILGLFVFGVSRSKMKVADSISLPDTISAKA